MSEPTFSGNDPIVPYNPAKYDPTPRKGEENRWDLDKARSVASASELVTSKSDEDEKDLPDATLLGIPNKAIEENRRFHEIEELLGQKGLDQEERDRLEKELYSLYESQGNYAYRTLNSEHYTRIIDRETTTAELLYDSNPERFSQMPTSEFIEVAKTYDSLKSQAESYEKAERHVNELLEQVEAAIAQRHGLLGNYINSYEDLLRKKLLDQNTPFGQYTYWKVESRENEIYYMNDNEFREYFGQLIPEPIDYFEDSEHTKLVKFKQAVIKVRGIYLGPYADVVPRYHRFLTEQGLPGATEPETA